MTPLWRRSALLFTLIAAAVAAHSAGLLGAGALKVDTDVLAMLPTTGDDETFRAATQKLSDEASRPPSNCLKQFETSLKQFQYEMAYGT